MGEAEAAEALSASKRRGAAAFTGLDGPPTRGNGPGTRVTRISQDWLESRPASPPLGGEVGCQGPVVPQLRLILGENFMPSRRDSVDSWVQRGAAVFTGWIWYLKRLLTGWFTVLLGSWKLVSSLAGGTKNDKRMIFFEVKFKRGPNKILLILLILLRSSRQSFFSLCRFKI